MVGIAHRDDADAAALCLADRQLHRFVTGKLPHRVVRVDDCGGRGLVDDLGHGVHVDQTLFNALVVAHQALHAVGFDAELVGHDEHIGDDPALALFEAELAERLHAEVVEQLYGEFHIFGHDLISPQMSFL